MNLVNIAMTSHNIVWFNGPSAGFFIHTLQKQHCEIGCNHIYRDRNVDHVVVFDQQMFQHIRRGSHTLWTKSGNKHPDFKEIGYPLRLQPHNSGVLALRLAINLKLEHVFVVGCDWGVSNVSRYDYGARNSELKYTNGQKRIVREMNREIDITFVSANSDPIDVPCATIEPSAFLRCLDS